MRIAYNICVCICAMIAGHWMATTHLPILSLIAGWTLLSIVPAMLIGKFIARADRLSPADLEAFDNSFHAGATTHG